MWHWWWYAVSSVNDYRHLYSHLVRSFCEQRLLPPSDIFRPGCHFHDLILLHSEVWILVHLHTCGLHLHNNYKLLLTLHPISVSLCLLSTPSVLSPLPLSLSQCLVWFSSCWSHRWLRGVVCQLLSLPLPAGTVFHAQSVSKFTLFTVKYLPYSSEGAK